MFCSTPIGLDESDIIPLNKNHGIQGTQERDISDNEPFPPYPLQLSNKSGNFVNFLNSSETCFQEIGWSTDTQSDLIIPTPLEYDSIHTSIDLNVMNATETTLNVETLTSNTRITSEVAQSFILTHDCFLTKLLLYITGYSTATRFFEIRAESPEGETLTSFSRSLTYSGWTTFSFSPYIFLSAGKYFVWKAYGGGSTTTRTWARDNYVNNTETYKDDGEGWETLPYDLPLRVYYYQIADPEAINMTVEGNLVLNSGEGKGHVEAENMISGTSSSLTVEYTLPVRYTYAANVTYYRNRQFAANYNILNGIPNWEVFPLLYNPGAQYTNYYSNLSGFAANYYDLICYFDTNLIPYTFLTLEFDQIQILQTANHIIWKSPNFLTSPQSPLQVFSGGEFSLNITSLGYGNNTLKIFNASETLVFSLSLLHSGLKNFNWTVLPSLLAGIYGIEWFFFSERDVGFQNVAVELVKVAQLTVDDVQAYALSNITLECSLNDAFGYIPLTSATVSVVVGELTLPMTPSPLNDGTYWTALNLDLFAIAPGSYTVYYVAENAGYQQIATVKSLVIQKRPATIRISQSNREFFGGETVDFKIILLDELTNEPLVRPVSISIAVYESSEGAEEQSVFFEIIPNILGETSVVWNTPENLKPGSYSVKVEAQSVYYNGIITQQESLIILKSEDLSAARNRMMLIIGITIIIPALGAVIIYQNIVRPRKLRKIQELLQKTAIFENMTNINGFLLIQKESGILLWEYTVNRLKGDSSLVSGFLQALMIFSRQFGSNETVNTSNMIADSEELDVSISPINIEQTGGAKDLLEFNDLNLNYLVVEGEYLRFVCVLNVRASTDIIERSRAYIKQIEAEFRPLLLDWISDQDEFIEPASFVLKNTFPLYIIDRYCLGNKYYIEKFRNVNSQNKGLMTRLFDIMDSLMEEQGFFKLQTVLRLVDPKERLQAKAAILEIITKQIIEPMRVNDVIHQE